MKKIKLKIGQIVNLFVNCQSYINRVGQESDKLSSACNAILEYDPNVKFLDSYNKRVSKLHKKLERDIRDESVQLASLYEDGEKKGTFIKNEKGDLTFTPTNQIKLNSKVDLLNDKYEAEVEKIMLESSEIYLRKVSELPVRLTIEDRNKLSLLIEPKVELS